MPRRMRIRFAGPTALQADAGVFSITGSNANLLKLAPTGSRLNITTGETNSQYCSKVLYTPGKWTVAQGDWFDINGIFRGTTPYISGSIVAGALSLPIGAIDGDLYITGIHDIQTAKIDGVAVDGFWVDPSSGNSLPFPTNFSDPVFIRNPTRGTTLSITTNTSSALVKVFKVAGPVINDRPTYAGATAVPTFWELEMIDEATIIARAGGIGNIDGGSDPSQWAYDPFFGVESSGLKYLRFCTGPTTGPRLITWFLPIAPTASGYFRYLLFIEDDVADGFNELGMKLPGPANSPSNDGQPSLISLRGEHSRNSVNNRGVYSVVNYWFTAETPPTSSGDIFDYNVQMRAGRWNVMEQFINLNTPGVPDGVFTAWLNGWQVFQRTNVLFRNDTSLLTLFHVNVYHGGLNSPTAKIHYRIAKIGYSATYMGVPAELRYPAWRQAITNDGAFHVIAGTTGLASNKGPQTWSCQAFTLDGRMYNVGQGGHASDTSDPGAGNGAYLVDFRADVPALSTVHGPTSPANTPAYFSMDGTFYPAHPNRAYYNADAGDVGIRPPSQGYYATVHIDGTQCFDSNERVIFPWLNAPRGQNGNANNRLQTDGFKTVVGQWDAGGSVGDTTGATATWGDLPTNEFAASVAWNACPPVCKDPRNGKIYWVNGWSIYVLNPAVSTPLTQWTRASGLNGSGRLYTFPNSWLGWGFTGSIVDTVRNRLLTITGTPATARCEYWALAGGTLQTASVTGMGAAQTTFTQCGLAHDLDNDRYLLLTSSLAHNLDELWAVNPTTFVSTLLTTRTPCCGSPGGGIGAFSGFAYVPNLGGCLLLPNWNKNCEFFPTR